MAMPIIPGYDLSTDPDLRWRIGKIASERVFRRLGVAIAETGPARLVADIVKDQLKDVPPKWLDTTVGVLSAAFVQSPHALADAVASFTGMDAEKIHGLLNEAVDSAMGGFSGKALRGPPSDADITTNVIEAMEKQDAGKFKHDYKFLMGEKVVIFGGVIHDRECTTVLDRERANRNQRKVVISSDGSSDDDLPRIRPDAREVTMLKAIDMGYSTIALPRCCGHATEKLMAKEMQKPMDLFSCVQAFEKAFANDPSRDAVALKAKYYQFTDAMNDAQNAELRDLGSRKAWTPQKVADYLQHSSDVASFLKRLKSEQMVSQKSLVQKVTGAIEAVFTGKGDSAEGAKLRENARKLQGQFVRSAGHAQRSNDALRARLGKR